jgi:hypothetical protein
VRIEETRGRVHAIEGTVYGWQGLLLSDAATKIPLAVNVGQMQDREALWARALSTQARMHLAGAARLHKVVFDQGFWDGTTLWWLDQPKSTLVVPAQDHMAVSADARAQALAGAGLTVGRRAHSVRHGQGQTAWTERLETEVVGMMGLTTSDQYGTPAHARQATRRDFQAHPLNAVVVPPVAGQGRRAGREHGVPDQCPGSQALAGLR